jgi:hypothetical protein
MYNVHLMMTFGSTPQHSVPIFFNSIEGFKMNSSMLLLCLFVVSLYPVALGASLDCTPQTCAPGPVVVTWTGNSCSGTPDSYYSYNSEAPGDCWSTSALSISTNVLNITADGIYQYVFDDDHCGHMVNYFLTMFGACRYNVNGNSSAMVLKDVNATFTPQTVSLVNPDQSFVGAIINGDCTSPDNCTYPSGAPLVYSHTYYNTTQCTQPTSATGYWNLTMGTCYGSPGESVRFDCSDYYVFTTYFSGNCKGPILEIQAMSTHDCIFEDPNNKKRDFFGGSKLSRDLTLYTPFSTAYKCGTTNIHPAPSPTSAASHLFVSLIPLVLLPLLFLA